MKVGQEVRVVANTTGHEFEIGEIVKIASLLPNGEIEMAEKLDGSDYWYLDEEDIEPITENK